jgi:hypothetical protein
MKFVDSKFTSVDFTGRNAIKGRCSARKLPLFPSGVTMATTGGVFLLERDFFAGAGATSSIVKLGGGATTTGSASFAVFGFRVVLGFEAIVEKECRGL